MISPDEQKYLLHTAVDQGWRISPLATAVALSAHDPEPYLPAKHLRMLSARIVHAVQTGGRLIVSMPPQHGKSQMTSKWTACWFLDNWPHKNIINCGYGASFARDWGRLVRNTIARYQDRFRVQLAADSTRADRWNTKEGGGMLCVGVGGGVTGRPAQLLTIDDPIKSWMEASSFTYRERIWNWYTNEARTRVHRGAAIILVMTRWNEDDLAGRLLKRMDEPWQVLELPAIYDEASAEKGPDPIGRQLGEALWPEKHDTKMLSVHMRQSLETWNSLYQQRPGTTAGLGNVYYSFKRKQNVKTCDRDTNLRLVWSLDFNIEPMCSIIAQYREYFGPMSHVTNEKYKIVEILDEICVDNMSTRDACDEFMQRAKRLCGNYYTKLEIYGDPGGQARHTSQVAGSDWDQIREFFRAKSGFEVKMCVKSSAPAIKDRTNSVNNLLRNALGEVQLLIDPKCKMLIRDLENVRWKRDLNGNVLGTLDKAQKDLTHVSDAAGYFIEAKWGRGQNVGEIPAVMQ